MSLERPHFKLKKDVQNFKNIYFVIGTFCVSTTLVLLLIWFWFPFDPQRKLYLEFNIFDEHSISTLEKKSNKKNLGFAITPEYYAVFSSDTPNGESYRTYDYAFNLPLTALAWERIGFKSLVIIIGSRCEWENDPALSFVLSNLEERLASVIFINSSLEFRPMLSQTARIFAINFAEFPGKSYDYVITSDSDLWPLRKEHYIRRPGNDIVLVHSDCCGFFEINNISYPMYPMSNIGATVSTWLQIINENQTVANDSKSILSYFEAVFGSEKVRSPVVVGKETWYLDQKMVSIRLSEWMKKHGDTTVHRVSDEGFSRINRNNWDANIISQKKFTQKFDAHLPFKTYLPIIWRQNIQPLINLMYGNTSQEAEWCENYAVQFRKKVRNYINFGNHY